MRVLIWDDTEGISGIYDPDSGYNDDTYKRLTTNEINAVVDGLRKGGATTIDIFDGHGMGNNLVSEELDPSVNYLGGGWMVTLAELIKSERIREYDALVLVGLHAQAGTVDGFIAHTNSSLTALRINEQPVGEIEQAGWLAGHFGVPLIYVAGDEAAVREAKNFFPEVEAVSVKKKEGESFVCRPVEDVYKESSDKAFKALNRIEEIEPSRCAVPITVKILFGLKELADKMELLPGYTRKDERTIVYEADDYLEAFWAYHGFRPILSSLMGEFYQKVLQRVKDIPNLDYKQDLLPVVQDIKREMLAQSIPFPEIVFE